MRSMLLTLALGLACAAVPALASRTWHRELRAVPAPGPVLIDGSLADWDVSGGILLCGDLATFRDTHSARLFAMHDAECLYLALDVRDATPLINHVDPAVEPDKGWQGDCVQVRLKTSPQGSGEVIWLDSWYYTHGKRPALTVQYPDLAKGTAARPTVDAIAGGGACAFTVAEDGAGYHQEMRVPWPILLQDGQPRQAGAAYRMGIEVVWGGAGPGEAAVHRATDLAASATADRKGFYGRPQAWGFLRLMARGDLAPAQTVTPDVGKPAGLREVWFESSADGSKQPALFYSPDTQEPAPLLVGLHSWSTDYTTGVGSAYARWCMDLGWVFIYPNFRGPNRRPQATGSDLAVGDILSAVRYARDHARVDPRRVYLVGASGGGHAALMMAGRAPAVWTAVSAWVGISDLAAWHRECKAAGRHYWRDVVASCGGAPGESPEVDRQYARRSPLTHLAAARGLPLDINAGIRDGHTGSVPISHSLRAFNVLADPADRLSEEQIGYFVEKAEVPPDLPKAEPDPDYGKSAPLFRRTSGQARVTIFRGGHAIVSDAALRWLARQENPAAEQQQKETER